MKCNMVGTLEFMAPEIMNCTFASPLSDMWSMGVLLFMMVSGGLSPFWSGSDYGTQRMVVRADFSQAKDLISTFGITCYRYSLIWLKSRHFSPGLSNLK